MLKLDDKTVVEKLQRAADGSVAFEPNAFLERLIEMREKNPNSFASISSSSLGALAWYEAARRRASMLKDD
jgi:hypothetical protein